MHVLLEDRRQIATAQRQLEKAFARQFPRVVVKDIGFPGDTKRDARVRTDGEHWYWAQDHHDTPNPRRLNWLGLFDKRRRLLDITVELNTPFDGRTGQVSSYFARNERTGQIYLLHSGRVGGGTRGVGKEAFLAWSNQRLTHVVDAKGTARCGVLVMPVNGKGAARGAIRYVDTIAAFKRAAREGAIDTRATRERRDALKRFYNEGRGRRSGRRKSQIDYETRHGDVVDALDAWREGRTMPVGARIVKNILLDLGVAKGTRLLEAYEVKTSTARQDLYTAIGQLMCHGEGGACRRTIVLPNDMTIAISFARTFAELGIGVLRFQLTSDAARIIDPLA